MLSRLIGIAFDGIAYGSLLFLMSVGLSVTMGLMNVVNLAHGAFAMFGGYACTWLMREADWPFLLTLPAAFLAMAALGAALERTLYRRLYSASHLDQVLFTIGLTFVGVATATYAWGPAEQLVELPNALRGQVRLLGVDFGVYRIFLVAVVAAVSLTLDHWVEKTRFGALVRAAVDNRRVAEALGVRVDRLFCLTFALGSGLAGLGGALGIDVLGLEPTFALKYLVYFLLVVAVGGTKSIKGTAVAALGLGLCDVVGKYYLPELGAFIIYALMVVALIAFPAGLYGRRA